MGTSTVSGPFRSANGFQELVNGVWTPVAGGGGSGGVANTCLVQIPINIDCTYFSPFSGSASMKLDLPFTVQEVTDSIASGGVWSKYSGYSLDMTITRYPRAGTPLANACNWWSYAFTYSNSVSPIQTLMVNPTVVDNGQYGYSLYTSCANPFGSPQPSPSLGGLSTCMGGGSSGFPYIQYVNEALITGSCGSPFGCGTSPDSLFYIRTDFCAYYADYWFAKTQCGVDIDAEGFKLTGVANVRLNFFDR